MNSGNDDNDNRRKMPTNKALHADAHNDARG
jgi:hypothetical protein